MSHWDQILQVEESEHLGQGDVLNAGGISTVPASIQRVILVSQTCDLQLHERRIKQSKSRPKVLRPQNQFGYVAALRPFAEWARSMYPYAEKLHNQDLVKATLMWNHTRFAYIPPFGGDGGWVVDVDYLFPVLLFTQTDDAVDLAGYRTVVESRVVSLTSPWRERLGEMVARKFNRVATADPTSADMEDISIAHGGKAIKPQ